MTDGAPSLRTLSPTYVAEQHGVYVEILKSELTKEDTDAPRNVALTGHYGSGKSSVLAETQRQLEACDLKVINLSLPSLGIGAGRTPKDGDLALDKTNLIQKEIVKQLLYRRRPSDTPASRFKRLDTFHPRPAYWRAFVVSAAVTGLALVMKLPTTVRDSFPSAFWAWIDVHIWGSPSGTFQWLSLLVVFVMTCMAAIWGQRVLQQRHVTEFAAGPTKVTLSESSTSYFDEYLDEIVYFFQTSKTVIVIFEDLDRFKDPHIFETLRELNLLLNNAEQTGDARIRFVYAIRDSIFERLDVDTEEASVGQVGSVSEDRQALGCIEAGLGDTRRLMSTNRTKFFDLVVPMVPFISHRTSRDLIGQELAAVSVANRPSNLVIDIVGAHLTDMRLIKNICNEYEVFRLRILTEDGLKELTADRLFASIVYKNLYLSDYEKIRDGTSQLDMLYRAYREWISQQTAAARAAERRARMRLKRLNSITGRSKRLGRRLQEVVVARHTQTMKASNVQVSIGGTTFSWSDLTEAGFWETCLRDRSDLTIHYPNVHPSDEVLSFDKVETLLGEPLSLDDWSVEDRAETQGALENAVADQRSLPQVSLKGALGQPDSLFTYRGIKTSMTGVAQDLFEGDELVLELIRSGFIDENYTLYVTQFPGQAISASAMNFIIKAVQPDVMRLDYHFGAGPAVEPDDIEAVLEAEPSRLFSGKSVYNTEIFDHLLAGGSEKLDEPIRRLAANASSDREFLDAYVVSGNEVASFVRRLSASWPGIFEYLIDHDPESEGPSLLDAALAGVRPETVYTVSAEQRITVSRSLPDLETVTTPQSPERARDIARVLEQIAVSMDELDVVAEPLRGEIVSRSLYQLSLANLRNIFDGDDSMLSLDVIKKLRESDVYSYVLTRLSDYFSTLDDSLSIPSVAERSAFADVLASVGNVEPDALEEVARRASSECVLDNVDELDAALWRAVVSAQRLKLTVQNVTAYLEQYGTDEPMAAWLSTAGAIELDSDESLRCPLALNLLNAETLADESKLKIVGTLRLTPGSIPAASLAKNAHTLLPSLIKSGLVNDDADAYTCLHDEELHTKEAVMTASESFPTYMTGLVLSAGELRMIVTRPVPDCVKGAVLDGFEAYADSFDPNSAAALARWAAEEGRPPNPDAIVTLAVAGGRASVEPILKLLGAQAHTIDLELLKRTLDALGPPYSQLTSRGRHRPKVPVCQGLEQVLERLRKENIVSKFGVNAKKSVFEVSKRYF